MQKPLAIAVIAVLGALLLWLVYGWQPTNEPGSAHEALGLATEPAGGDFRLQSAAGPVRLSDFRGKVVLIYFGYTWCPDVCPTNLAIIALALQQLTVEERNRVQVLFISVDPERDTPGRLHTYTRHFHPNILGLTGSEAAIERAARRYGAAYRRAGQSGSAMGYAVDHSSYVYVIDPGGRLVETLAHATPADTLVATIRRYLAPAS